MLRCAHISETLRCANAASRYSVAFCICSFVSAKIFCNSLASSSPSRRPCASWVRAAAMAATTPCKAAAADADVAAAVLRAFAGASAPALLRSTCLLRAAPDEAVEGAATFAAMRSLQASMMRASDDRTWDGEQEGKVVTACPQLRAQGTLQLVRADSDAP